uniref:Uncharacterized protein n=1 Tax=Bartonella rochalimae ATCC BAA-1498 TaxID=685782 RepID=E6YL77_9HYPH|nr:hypothetical protein BARRO_30196 [Bartonella rochalimae ATCC BAA-1498]
MGKVDKEREKLLKKFRNVEIIEIYSRRVAKNYVYQGSNFYTAYK